ncbi:MAG: flagellar export protein FliJ [Deltaproteobacteria bacterium]|nr:flagellar export protein FliJ [Deltaproteobacteria bacterium]MBW2659804.1 flagellar export protein FliJ [Deltaproteobacteria bacterium]
MKPFTLETVLTYRKRLEDTALLRLNDAKEQEEIILQKLNEKKGQLDLLINKSSQLQSETISIPDLINYENRIFYLKEKIAAVLKKLEEKIENTKAEQHNLNEKIKQRKIMENLKDQQNRLWQEHLDKKETALADEVGITRHRSRNLS